jgi:hypothetical protein
VKKISVFGTMMAATLICAGTARSETVFVASTGFDGSGNQLDNAGVDANYTLTMAPGGSGFSTPGNAYAVVTPGDGGYPVPPWLANDVNSEWISPDFSTNGFLNAAPGNYEYTTTFNLTGYDPNTFALNGQLATDDTLVAVILNGTNIGTAGAGGAVQSALTAFNVDQSDAAGDFLAGVNTLTFEVNNIVGGDNNPTGLRVEVDSVTASPEPGTLGLLGSALVGIGLMARRRRSK